MGTRTPKKKMDHTGIKPEAWVTKQFKKEYAMAFKDVPYVMQKMSDRYNSGWPDYQIIKDGVTRYYELKAWNKRPTPKQEVVCEKLMKAGASVYLFRAREYQGGVETVTYKRVAAGWQNQATGEYL